MVQATLVDTWAATAAGAFALSENNLYTSDAFRDYLTHLTDDGVLAITRWGFDPPRESLRLISLAIDALAQTRREGAVAARDRFAAGLGGGLRRAGYRAGLAQAVQRGGYRARPGGLRRGRAASHLLSREPDAEPVSRSAAEPAIPAEYERNYTFDITPVTDDRPFFFYTVQPRDLWEFMKGGAKTADRKINKAVPLLFGLMAISLVATLVILIAPPLVLGTRLPRQRGVRGFLVYFLFIGAGYILIEVGLIQKFVLFLGHPDLRADGGDLLDADVERPGQFLQPPRAGRRRRPADQGAGTDGAADGAAGARGVFAA